MGVSKLSSIIPVIYSRHWIIEMYLYSIKQLPRDLHSFALVCAHFAPVLRSERNWAQILTWNLVELCAHLRSITLSTTGRKIWNECSQLVALNWAHFALNREKMVSVALICTDRNWAQIILRSWVQIFYLVQIWAQMSAIERNQASMHHHSIFALRAQNGRKYLR